MLETTELMLVLAGFAGSLMSVSVGTSCGLLFAAMVSVLPPTTALPLHGLIEGISSGLRWAVLRRYVSYRYLFWFMAGSSVGLMLGWPLIGLFSDQHLTLLLGLFLLITLWFPLSWLKLSPLMGGMSTSCLTILVGATGPLVAALLARRVKSHRTAVGTQGACTLFQHWGKVVVFAVSGFSFSQHVTLIVALIAATLVGTLLGRQLLKFVPTQYLRMALRSVVSLLAIRLLLIGLDINIDNTPIVSGSGAIVLLLLTIVSCYMGYRIGYHQKR